MPLTPEELTAAWKLAGRMEKKARATKYLNWVVLVPAIMCIGLGVFGLVMYFHMNEENLARLETDLRATTQSVVVTKGELYSVLFRSMGPFPDVIMFILPFVFLMGSAAWLQSVLVNWSRWKRDILLAKIIRSYLEQQGQGPQH